MMLDEKRLLESRRTVRRDEVKPSIPAANTAAAIPYQMAIRRTTASASVKVSRSRVSFDPTGILRCCGKRPTRTTRGTNARSVSFSSPMGGTTTRAAATAHRPIPRAEMAVWYPRLTKLARSAVMLLSKSARARSDTSPALRVPAGTRVPTKFNMGSSNRQGIRPPVLPVRRPPGDGGHAGSPFRHVRRSVHADPVHAGPGIAEEHGDPGLLEHVAEDEPIPEDEAVPEHEPVPE